MIFFSTFHEIFQWVDLFLLLFHSLPKTQTADDKYVSKQLNQLQKSSLRGAQLLGKGG